MKPSREQVRIVQQELQRLSSQGKVRQQGQRTFILCPFHDDKNPSAIITTDANSKYFGCFKCFGCGTSGGWNKLAKEMGLREIDPNDNGYGLAVKQESSSFKKRTQDTSERKAKPTRLSKPMKNLGLTKPKPVREDWRGIPKTLLKKVQAITVIDPWTSNRELYLPCFVKEEEVGGIRALLNAKQADERIPKYRNSVGAWSKTQALYPYDYTAQLIDAFEEKHGFRAVIIVEGARDSLTLINQGLPTLGILGTTSWAQEKQDLLLDLDPDFVLICMDGDAAGIKAERMIHKTLSPYLPVKKMNLARFNKYCGFEVDPGAAPPEIVGKIRKALLKGRL